MKTILALCVLCSVASADEFRWAVDSSPFSWSVTEKGGDDLSPNDSATTGTDAPNSPGPVVAPALTETATGPLTSVCPCGGSNRGVCHCLATGVTCRCSPGVGSEWLMADGRPIKKTGRYADPRRETQPSRSRPAESAPKITIRVAPFYCPPCEAVKAMDWSEFDVTFETGGASAYPQIEWTDPRGTKRFLTGRRTPWQVKWSWDRTQ